MVGVLGCWCGCRPLLMFFCVLLELYCWCPGMLVLLSDNSFVLLCFSESVLMVSCVVGAVAGLNLCSVVFWRNCLAGVIDCWCGCQTFLMFYYILQELYDWFPVLLVWMIGINLRSFTFCRNCMVGVLVCWFVVV